MVTAPFHSASAGAAEVCRLPLSSVAFVSGPNPPQPSCRRLQKQSVGSESAIRQETWTSGHFPQLLFGAFQYPDGSPHLQPLVSYSSSALKMWQVSWAKVVWMLSGPRPSLEYSITSRSSAG